MVAALARARLGKIGTDQRLINGDEAPVHTAGDRKALAFRAEISERIIAEFLSATRTDDDGDTTFGALGRMRWALPTTVLTNLRHCYCILISGKNGKIIFLKLECIFTRKKIF